MNMDVNGHLDTERLLKDPILHIDVNGSIVVDLNGSKIRAHVTKG